MWTFIFTFHKMQFMNSMVSELPETLPYCFPKQVFNFSFTKYINEIIQYVVFCAWVLPIYPDLSFLSLLMKLWSVFSYFSYYIYTYRERERETETETETDRESDIVVLMCISLMISEYSFEIYLIKILPTWNFFFCVCVLLLRY